MLGHWSNGLVARLHVMVVDGTTRGGSERLVRSTPPIVVPHCLLEPIGSEETDAVLEPGAKTSYRLIGPGRWPVPAGRYTQVEVHQYRNGTRVTGPFDDSYFEQRGEARIYRNLLHRPHFDVQVDREVIPVG